MSAVLPKGWQTPIAGYAVQYGKPDSAVAYCDARGDRVITWARDGQGVPHDVVRACIEAASDFPPEFKP